MWEHKLSQEKEDLIANLVDDADFLKIDGRYGRFNIFEAIGAVRGELRHSNFLAFLLTPHGSHGLGSEFLQKFLRGVLSRYSAVSRPVRSLELVVGDLDEAQIYRETDNIDLTIEIKELNLVVIVENEIGSKAGEGQLDRYKTVTKNKYPTWRHMFVFLTPDGDDPEDNEYVAFSYSDLSKIMEGMIAESGSQQPSELVLILRHSL